MLPHSLISVYGKNLNKLNKSSLSSPGFFALAGSPHAKQQCLLHVCLHVSDFFYGTVDCLLTGKNSCYGADHGLLCLYAVLLGRRLVKEVA